MNRTIVRFGICLSLLLTGSPVVAQQTGETKLKLNLRSDKGVRPESWNPKQTAIIVCDMWDAHHCLNAVRRAEEMAPRMNEFLKAARNRGVLIIHAPSSCMNAYATHPGRALAMAAPRAANLPEGIG